MTAKNYWATYKGDVARWEIELPAALCERWGDVARFAAAVRAAGHAHGVYLAGPTKTPAELFPEGRQPARVAVFGPGGAVVERTTDDLAALIRELRPDVTEAYLPRVAALDVTGPRSPAEVDGAIVIGIATATDLWFPQVVGELEGLDVNRPDDQVGPTLRDNRALAERNAPRLNQFLAAVREAAAALGGTWSHDATFHRYYQPLVGDEGIRMTAALTDTAITWEPTGDFEFPFKAEVGGQRLTIRVNDFPAEPMYTLIVDGKEQEDLDDWPARWTRPQTPQHLLDMVAAKNKK